MQINTRFFGETEIPEENIVTFPQAIYGFEGYHEFGLISFDENDDGLICMQSLKEKDLAFILLNPYTIEKDYPPTATDEDLAVIKASADTGLLIYVIASIKEDGGITANFKCPIVINSQNRLAVQIILTQSEYSMKHPVIIKTEQGEE